MEVKEVEELTTKMNEMDNILKQNIFTNPIKVSNEKMRQEILALKSILKKKFNFLLKHLKKIFDDNLII